MNHGDRLSQLRDVTALLDAHVIALQAITDRAALVILPAEWHLVPDENRSDLHGLGAAVRIRLRVAGSSADLGADDEHVLFAHETEILFPSCRELLAVPVRLPDESAAIVVMLHHGTPRAGVQATRDSKAEGAACTTIQGFERDVDARDFILLGNHGNQLDILNRPNDHVSIVACREG